VSLDIDPHTTGSRTVVLNQWIDFSKTGTYEVTTTFSGPVRTSAGTALAVDRVFRQRITILPRDQVSLRDTCDRLLKVYESQSEGFASYDALQGLTHTIDPVAVPYLLRAAEGRRFADQSISALAKIGGPEARSALETLSRHSDGMVALLARQALRTIK
jgi:hypothetical protein